MKERERYFDGVKIEDDFQLLKLTSVCLLGRIK